MSLAPPQNTPLVPGQRLDRYELLCPIAQGGMASVWIARLQGKHGFEKLVAIKTILPQYASDSSFRNMFLDEAHIAAGIEHANVAQILDLGEEHGVLYIAMEWVDGDALSKLYRAVEKKGIDLPVPLLLRVMADACAGLHAAHELRDKQRKLLNVVHRDVSPQNILVTTKGIAKIIDFGIAKARDRVGGETSTGVLKGKIQYMAPEQATGKAIDRRADLWAIGAILYHYLAGRPPFHAENQLATLHLLTSGKPPLPLPTSKVPRPVIEVVRGALQHDVTKRFATAADLQRAIEAAMGASGLSATTADLSDFVSEHLKDRNETRNGAIDIALNAAAERARMDHLLKPSLTDPGVRTLGTNLGGGTPVSYPGGGAGTAFPDLEVDIAPTRVEEVPGSQPLVLSAERPSGDFSQRAAAVSVPVYPPRRPSRTGLLVGIVGATLGLGALGVVGVFALRTPKVSARPAPPVGSTTAVPGGSGGNSTTPSAESPIIVATPPVIPPLSSAAPASSSVMAAPVGSAAPLGTKIVPTTTSKAPAPGASGDPGSMYKDGEGKWKRRDDGF